MVIIWPMHSCSAVKCLYTWQDSVADYIFQQYLEPCQEGIQNLEPSPHWLHVSEHILQDALSLLHHRRHYRAQTALYPTCKTIKYLCIPICAVLHVYVYLRERTEYEPDLGGQGESWQVVGRGMAGGGVSQLYSSKPLLLSSSMQTYACFCTPIKKWEKKEN